ncbi:MAG TPA: DUF6064 family protein, partial [Gammaproteobacteria bacterium]|nr:DUF6064 family protein [Gammaproteobacteria bacterium]
MSEWRTYELSNFLLFSPRTYDRLVESYNAALWPGQALAVLSGIAIVILTLRRGKRASFAAAALLALVWLWLAWAFHLQRYAPINWAARWFAVAFGIEGMMILASEWRKRVPPDRTRRAGRLTGLALATFAILALPVTERFLGVPWTRVEVFALFPDATAVATLGILISRERL